jgi:hypothetical protein
VADLLPDAPPIIQIDNDTRRRAALSVAELNAERPHEVVFFLVMLGLAEDDEGVCRSTSDRTGESWFAPLATRR